MFRVCLAAVIAACAFASTAQAATVMSCGSSYRSKPSSCKISGDTTAASASLSSLRWSGWGSQRATAKGRQAANHRDRDGSLPRYRTTVQVGGLDFCNGRSYYTQLRLKTSWPGTRARYSEWSFLRTPCS